MLTLTLSSALGIVIRTLIIYFVILIGLRLSGEREIGQMTVFDLVVLLLIANAVQNAMVDPDTSLMGGIIAAVVLLLVNAAVARVRLRWPRLRRWVEGTPTLLVLHGETINHPRTPAQGGDRRRNSVGSAARTWHLRGKRG